MDMFDRLIAREGGAKVVSDPWGGLTKFGISQNSYPQLDIRNLTYDGARAIYVRDYYHSPGLDHLPEGLQEYVLDFCVHSGVQCGIKYLQKITGSTQDGVIGPETIANCNKYPLPDIIYAYKRERVLFLARQVVANPKKLNELVGWQARVLSF